ncbi:MAG TPA: DinB family protein [Puia sp.]|jgi:uncharacterized damage-inducible protein DinB|nr:DinB family protein [Puia sp.]
MNNQELFIKMVIDSWQNQLNSTNSMLSKISDEQLMHEVSPSRNRGIYLLGHLAAVHDLMLPLLRLGEPMFPELRPIFIDAPDKTVDPLPPASQLREQWQKVNEALLTQMKNLPPDEWFTRHSNISEEDFPKEPNRNRLNVLLGRTNHLSYHRGQLAFLVPKS